MLNIVLEDCIADLRSPFLVKKLGRVTAHEDHGGLLRELSLQILHVWQHMKAVDAAIGPKVDENELVFELIAEGERLRIQPSVSPRELFDFELLNIRQTISYFFEVFHRVRIRLGKVLITQIDVALCEDVTVTIVVSVLSQLIGKTLRVVKDLHANHY